MIRSRKKNLAAAMRAFVEARFPHGIDRVECDNCGMEIRELKFENISHIRGRGVRPDLREDPDNLRILCGPMDYWGRKDESCHTLYDSKKLEQFKAKETVK